jgi:L-ribulokinase
MGRKRSAVYVPNARRADAYDALYAEYSLLHDHFGVGPDGPMHRLRDIRRRAVREPEAVQL